MASRSYHTNPTISKQADADLNSYLAAGLTGHSNFPWAPPMVVVPNGDDIIRIIMNLDAAQCEENRWQVASSFR